LVGEAVYTLYHSPRFDLVAVKVIGAGPKGELLIRKKLPVPGISLFAISRTALERALINREELSFVRRVAVKRRLPGTLLVTVQQRRPIAYLDQPWGEALLDAGGVVFTSPDSRPRDLPELQGLEVPEQALGKVLSGDRAKALQEGLAALAKSPKLKIKVLAIDKRGWLTAYLAEGPELRLGEAKNLATKVAQVEVALTQTKAQQAAVYLDFSAPEAPVWKPK
jgi:cell division septal protein FtsQ